MDPLVTAGIISGASALIGSGGQALVAGKMNRKTRAWQEKMTQRQREWALEDFDRINAYNDPAAMMARYKNAGLNPHLIYGQKNEGATVRGVSTPQWNPDVPDIKSIGNAVGGSVLNYIDLKQRSAQIELTRETVRTQQADQALKAAETANKAAATARSKFDLDLASELRETSLQFQQRLLEEKTQGIGISAQDAAIRQKDYNLREAINAKNLQEASQRIAESASRMATSDLERQRINENINLLQKDNMIKELDVRLAQEGIRPGDPVYARYIKKLADWITDTKKQTDKMPSTWQRLKKLWELLP